MFRCESCRTGFNATIVSVSETCPRCKAMGMESRLVFSPFHAVRKGGRAPVRRGAREGGSADPPLGWAPVSGDGIELSAAQARRAALAAQGFGRPRPGGRVDVRHLRRAIEDVGLLQLDSVNAFSRSHYVPLFSRLGPYPRATLDRMAAHGGGSGATGGQGGAERGLFEYWGHEASLLPVALQPLLRWRMARVDQLAWKSVRRIGAERAGAAAGGDADGARARAAARRRPGGRARRRAAGAPRPGRCGAGAKRRRRSSTSSSPAGSAPRTGSTSSASTTSPSGSCRPPSSRRRRRPRTEAQRRLLLLAAARLGVATEPDLGDYFRLPRTESKARVAELVEAGELLGARVEGWGAPAYVLPGRLPTTRRRARALLTPFDSLVWSRPAHRAALRLPLPDRDLHAGGEAGPRLLRAALPARRPPGREGRR